MAIRAYREPQNKSSGGCSTISVRSSSMSVVTAAAARSSIARQSARTWRPVAVSRAPLIEAALCGLDQRFSETGVHGLGENPGAMVAHTHAPSCPGDRAGFADRFQERRLAGTDRDR